MPSLFPTHNNLNLESFRSTNLADAPLHLTSCKLQMSTLCLDITSTTSFDRPLIVPTFYKHTLKLWCDNWLTIWRCSYPPALLSHWNVLKTVILYIVATFYSWMLFLMSACHSQGQTGIFRETPSHQIVELLKRSTKCLHDLLYIHHQGCDYFCRKAYTLPIFRVSLVVLAFPVTTTGK